MGAAGDGELADFRCDPRLWRVTALAAGIGLVSTALGAGLLAMIRWCTSVAYYGDVHGRHVSPADHGLGAWAILVPLAGGLLVGLLARYGSEQIRGHGIPEAIDAILTGESRMSPKVALLKPLSAAIAIGTGGPFGAEGPIVVTGGAAGSLVASRFAVSAAERKTLLVAGAAAGMTAIFGTPVAAVLLGVEVLLFEWRPRSVIPVAAAAAVASLARGRWFEPPPIFPLAATSVGPATVLGGLVLGLAAGLLARVLTTLLHAVEDGFERLPVPWMWWPALGGLVVGLGGRLQPRALGVGYDVIGDLLHGRLVGAALVSLLLVKAVIWLVALGSGTSGGVLAPLLILGGAGGAALAGLVPGADPALGAALGMAALLAGTLRAPLTAVLFALETTHVPGLLPGTLAACMTAYAITVTTMPRSILTAKLARRGQHLTCEYGIDPFELVRVAAVMDPEPPVVAGSLPVAELSARIAAGDPQLRRQGIAVVDAGRLIGLVTRTDILAALAAGGSPTVAEVATRELLVTWPDEPVRDAAERMLRHNVGRLPVVDRADPQRLVGYLGRADVMAARLRLVHEDRIVPAAPLGDAAG